MQAHWADIAIGALILFGSALVVPVVYLVAHLRIRWRSLRAIRRTPCPNCGDSSGLRVVGTESADWDCFYDPAFVYEARCSRCQCQVLWDPNLERIVEEEAPDRD
jgi:hypothetical protein